MSGKKKKRSPIKKVIKVTLISLLSIFLIGSVIISAVALGMIKTAPALDLNIITSFNQPTTFYDDKGNLIDEYLTIERRNPVNIEKVPKNLINAFISIEDERFKTHHGIDLKRIAGSTLSNIKNIFKGSKNMQGGSTITQQLIKQRYFLTQSLKNRLSFERKVQEMYLAVQLEKKLSKSKILESYMNTIFLGGNAYGVKSAARQYFNKDLDKLNLTECAFIASCAQSPSVSYGAAKYAFEKNTIHESPRTKAVLGQMLKTGCISHSEYDSAIKPQLKYSFNRTTRNKMNYEWFSRPVIEAVINDLQKEYKYSDNEVNNLLAYGGLQIYTTMNTEVQKNAEQAINDSTDSKKKSWDYIFPRDYKSNPIQPKLQASGVIMDYRTGEVKAIVGGRGEQGPLSYNRAASSKFLRPPGSSIKPLTVYSPAIDTKISTAGTIFSDSPIPPDIGKLYVNPGEAPYNPKNDNNKYSGPVTLRDALKHSLNVVAVKIEHEINLKTGVAYGEKYGLQLDRTDKRSMAAIALGQLDGGEYSGTNPLTMATAYGAFGNNGKLTKPRLYTKVKAMDGKLLLETKAETKKIISPEAAYIMYDLLKGPVSEGGTGGNANFDSMSVRGKTGTSSNKKNLWFTGLTPYYSAAVWIGNDDSTEIEGRINSNTSAKLWSRIMKNAHKGLQDKEINKPDNIVYASISKYSGKLPTQFTYENLGSGGVYNEMFISGTEPISYDDTITKPKETENKIPAVPSSTGDTILPNEPPKPPNTENENTDPNNKDNPPNENNVPTNDPNVPNENPNTENNDTTPSTKEKQNTFNGSKDNSHTKKEYKKN